MKVGTALGKAPKPKFNYRSHDLAWPSPPLWALVLPGASLSHLFSWEHEGMKECEVGGHPGTHLERAVGWVGIG